MGNLKKSERKLMLDEIMFYSICSDEDREKILGQKEMSFEDFRRLTLLTDYLDLTHLLKFIWDLHSHRYMDQIDELYQKCEDRDQLLPEMLKETSHWMENFWESAPNPTVSYLLHKIFLNGLAQHE